MFCLGQLSCFWGTSQTDPCSWLRHQSFLLGRGEGKQNEDSCKLLSKGDCEDPKKANVQFAKLHKSLQGSKEAQVLVPTDVLLTFVKKLADDLCTLWNCFGNEPLLPGMFVKRCESVEDRGQTRLRLSYSAC